MNITHSSAVRLFAAASVLLSGCFMEAARPTPEQVARAESQGLTVAQLDVGRDLFVERCTICHMAPRPSAVRANEWPDEMRHMARRAKISAAQTELITAYLQTVSAP